MASPPCACTTIRKAARAITRFYDEAIERGGLTSTQFAVLRAVEREGDAPMSRVADALVMDRTSLYRVVAPLVRDRLLRCSSSNDDARAKHLTLTPLGRAQIARAARHWAAAQSRVEAHVGTQQWQRMSVWLTELADEVRTWSAEDVR